MAIEFVATYQLRVQCEWEMEDGYGCVVTEYLDMPSLMEDMRNRAVEAMRQSGWQIPVDDVPGKVLCPGCVGRPTDASGRHWRAE